MYYEKNNNNNYGVYKNSFAGVMNKVYGIMFIGLLLTAITSYVVASNTALANVFLGGYTPYLLMIGEVGFVWYLSSRVLDMDYMKAFIMFALYSILNGLTLSVIFFVFELGSIYSVFFITAGVFGVMSAYGYFTKTDLTGLGKILFFGVMGLIIAHIGNIFMKSPALYLYISYAGVIIFLGLTAYNTQKIKRLYNQTSNENVAIFGALILYLDFINLFIYLLRILGSRRD